MPKAQGKPAHIIWQSDDQTITIIDIPRSIEDAQHDGDSTSPFRITSVAPIATPFVMPEPKTEAARTRLIKQHPEPEEHLVYESLYTQTIHEIGKGSDTAWVLDRVVVDQEEGQRSRSKRKHSVHNDAISSIFKSIGSGSITCSNVAGTACEVGCSLDLADWPVVHNPSTEPLWLNLGQSNAKEYLLPPRSSLLCDHITMTNRGTVLRQAFRAQCGSMARFDLVVLDPPWHNASVKRSRLYDTTPPPHTADLLAATDLDMLLNDQSLVCVWITNKASARTAVLGERGIFAQWGVQLIEEWIWYKVTSTRELIFPMSTITRKPYEVLLVGRKHRTYPIPPPPEPLRRRALLAVPDVHSRKPCLKPLLEPLLATPETDYNALEVFARHLVAGWWSWGDECILFNEKKNWNT